MNKLISRNPILRFKEGRKIIKAYEGFKTKEGSTGNYYYTGRDGKNYVASLYGNKWVYGLDDGNFKVIGDVPKNYETTGGIKFYSDLGQALSREAIARTPRKPWTPEQIKADRAAKGIKDTTITVKQAEKNNKVNLGKTVANGNKTNTGGTATSVVKSTPTSFMGQGIQQGWRGTVGDISGVTEAQRLQLINSGRFTMDDFKNAETLLTALNRELSGLGKGTISVDNKWGTLSQKALLTALVGLPAMHPTSLSENSAALQMTPKPITYTVNNLAGTTGNTSVLGGTYTPGVSVNGVSTILNSILNMNLPTYNRRGVRDYLRAKGFNPYSFSGALRKALRMTLNNTGNGTDSAIVLGMGLFKKGGLISRNPVKQFKVNFRKEAL